MDNFRDKRKQPNGIFYNAHPMWIQGNLYEDIDPISTHTGEVYMADANNTLVSIETGYHFTHGEQFEGGKWKDISDEVWLLIVPKKEV